MKVGKYAIYSGKEYTAGIMKEGKIILRSMELEDIKLGFEKCEPFIFKGEQIQCIKLVDRAEVSEFYRIKTKALYKGLEFEVMDEEDEMISIVGVIGDYREFLNLGMKCIDKGVYQKWINKEEVEIKVVKEQL